MTRKFIITSIDELLKISGMEYRPDLPDASNCKEREFLEPILNRTSVPYAFEEPLSELAMFRKRRYIKAQCSMFGKILHGWEEI